MGSWGVCCGVGIKLKLGGSCGAGAEADCCGWAVEDGMLNIESIWDGMLTDAVEMDGNGAIIRGKFDADEALVGEIAKIG